MLNCVKPSILSLVATLIVGVAVGFGVFGSTLTAHSQSTVTGDTESQLFRAIYTRINPSVVSINVRMPVTASNSFQQSPFGQIRPGQGGMQQYQYAAGSGFVYDTAGHIVTNAHVVSGTDQVEVTFSDGTMMHAKTIGIDLYSDLAVIQVQGDTSKYQAVPLANSDAVQVGDRVLAIGNPFENAGTMTQGIVSGLHREVSGLVQNYIIPDVIQTDAAINPGNSGGPLLSVDGQVIGVNELIKSPIGSSSGVAQSSGVSFSIPSNLVKQVSDTLIQSGKVEHTYLGIAGGSLYLDLNEALKLPPNTHGTLITSVQPGSPAATAGLRAGNQSVTIQGQKVNGGGDIIIAVDKQPAPQYEDLTAYLFTKTKVGQTVTLTILRDGAQQDIQVTLAARPAATDAATTPQ